MTSSDYIPAKVVFVRRAQNIIAGCSKGIIFDDSARQERRTVINDDPE